MAKTSLTASVSSEAFSEVSSEDVTTFSELTSEEVAVSVETFLPEQAVKMAITTDIIIVLIIFFIHNILSFS